MSAAIDVDHALVDAIGGLGRRRHRNPHGIAQQFASELLDLLRHGRREEQRLALSRNLCDDLTDVADEAHVEHPVGLVQHEHFDAVEPHGVVLHQIEEPARGRDQHVDAVNERPYLAAHRHAADGERRCRPYVTAIGAEALQDLSGKLARRAEHEHAAGALLGAAPLRQQVVQDR